VININVWASLCVPAGNPDVLAQVPSSGLGGLRGMLAEADLIELSGLVVAYEMAQ
jgi:hypothetical protein